MRVNTQKPSWTGLRRTNGGKRVAMKKWNFICKNQYIWPKVTNTWHGEDLYRILFPLGICPEGPQGFDFFENGLEIWTSKKTENQKILNSDSNRALGLIFCAVGSFPTSPDRFWGVLGHKSKYFLDFWFYHNFTYFPYFPIPPIPPVWLRTFVRHL